MEYRTVLQHGDNEEARLFIDDVSLVKGDQAVLQELFRDWSWRLHNWLDTGIEVEDGTSDEDLERLTRKFTRD